MDCFRNGQFQYYCAVYKVVNVNSYLRIREGPSTNSREIGSLKNGQLIFVLSRSNGWAKFYKGYVSESYIKKTSHKLNYETTTDLNFRIGPSTNHKIITTLKKNVKIINFGRDPFNNSWAVTNKGYAFAKNLKKIPKQEQKTQKKQNTSKNSVKGLVTSLLKFEEGKGKNENLCDPYKDSNGFPTIGYGQLCAEVYVSSDAEARGPCSSYVNVCSEAKAEEWLSKSIDEKTNCIKNTPLIWNAYNKASNKRKAIIISMAYQMGCGSTGFGGFVNTLTNMAQGNWEQASYNMLDSKWYREDSSERAERHAYVIRYNECSDFCSYYGW